MTPEEIADEICTRMSVSSAIDRSVGINLISAAIREEQSRYVGLWSCVSSWCNIQIAHPGCLPDTKALRDALDKRRPYTS